ncbi:MAG TPA: hypothetical protein VEW03_09895 [Longimicrobiaceae bacterium]|nr:hypothetical protein [Longimicrobiaceae bacterium]
MAASGGSQGGAQPQADSPWEWVVAGIGALLVSAVIAFLAYEAVTFEGSPPDIVVRVDSVSHVGGGYLVHLQARNRGGTTASSVGIEAELRTAAGEVETRSVDIDYIPAHSLRHAGVVFGEDPRGRPLEVRTTGFDLP